MSHFERGSERHPIPPGESALAMEAAGPSVVPGPGGPGRRALLRAAPDGEVVIVKVQGADLTINGVRLGSEPTPLLHGDKVGADGVELTFVDDRRSGSTVFMAAMQAPVPHGAGLAGAAGSAGATAGRLVCLTDGREYTVGGSSVVFGREAGCDIVVAAKDVSRRHAEILPTAKGYVLIDHSTNGTFVNDERIPGQRLLARGDVIRVGTDEFRFYAEQDGPRESGPRRAALQATLHGFPVDEIKRAVTPPPVAREAPPAPQPPPRPSAVARPSVPGVPRRASGAYDAVRGEGAARPSQQGPRPLASFLLREGAQRGTRLPVRSAVANVGRAEYNDVMLDDGSVSAQHAKLQRREGIWVLVDLESTNGTFVDGERVKGEAALAPGSTVRFGDVQAIFEPLDEALGMGTGAPKTSLLARESVEALEERVRAAARAPAAPSKPPPAAPPPLPERATPTAPASPARPAPVASPRAAPVAPPLAEPAAPPPAEPAAPPDAEEVARGAEPPLIAPVVSGRGGGVGRREPAPWSAAGGYRVSMGARRTERLRVVLIGALIVVAVAVTALILVLT